ncbi:MAG: NUDIX domain-containing protein [Clostridia bacterium]|nr:NUDIX domain-containing protein [Clostridia bacterium]
MELLEIYNEKGEPTGKSIERGNKNLQENEYIKLAVLWIKSGNKFLIQKASVEKDNDYAVTGGHVPFGTTSLEQAAVETEEELGLTIDKNKLVLLGTITRGHGMFDVYLYEDDTLINYPFVLQEEEVEAVQFMTTDEIESLIEQGLFRGSSTLQYNQLIKGKF